MGCEEFRAGGAELALGIASAQERAGALAHMERCGECRRHAQQMREVAEALTGLVPPVDPPAGFEARAVAGLVGGSHPVPGGTGSVASPGAGSRPARVRGPALRAAAVAAAVVAAGAGGWLVGTTGSGGAGGNGGAPVAAGHLLTASLVSGQRRVGQVVVSTGSQPWVAMAVEGMADQQWVTCQLRDGHGAMVTVGSFSLAGGHGYWVAPLPDPSMSVTGARLVGAGGQVMAAADIPVSRR